MERLKIKAQKRTTLKKTKKLVHEGMTPAVIYDQKCNSQSIKVPTGDLEKILATATKSTIIEIQVDDEKSHIALITEVQNDIRLNQVRHVSFMSLDPKKEITIPVQLTAIGESEAVKNSLGILLLPNDTIELRGLPDKMPAYIEIDITSLKNIGDTIRVSDLTLPEGVALLHEKDEKMTIATITPFQKAIEEEEEKPEEDGEEEVEGGEVEGEGEGEGEGETEGKEGEETQEKESSKEAPDTKKEQK